MILLRATTFWILTIGSVRGSCHELGELIKRIHSEIQTATVHIVGVKDFCAFTFDIPVIIYTRHPSQLASFEGNAILVVQSERMLDASVQYSDLVDAVVERIAHYRFVVAVAETPQSLDMVFPYFWKLGFTRIFGVTDGVLYAYLPYADIPVQEVRDKGALPNGLRDMNGFCFRTTVQSDVPRAFWFQDMHDNWQVGGYAGQLFLRFLKKHNATFVDVILSNFSYFSMPTVLNATINGDIDISMNTYSSLEGVDMSYPIRQTSWVVMVPINGHVDPNQYFLRPFSLGVWIFIGFTIIYITVMDILNNYIAGKPLELWIYISRTILTVISMPTQKRITSAYRFHAQVLLLAFILTNLYLIHLTSFLTVYIKVKQFDSVQDLIDNKVAIMMPDYEWDDIADPELHVEGLEKIVLLVDISVYTRERNSMRNTSVSYAVAMDKAEYLLQSQAKPLFRTISDSLLDFHSGFFLRKHSPFRRILDNFIIEIMDTGLIGKWTRDTVVQAGHIVNRPSAYDGPAPLTLHQLRFAWITLGLGLTAAAMAFALEHILASFEWLWKKLKFLQSVF